MSDTTLHELQLENKSLREKLKACNRFECGAFSYTNAQKVLEAQNRQLRKSLAKAQTQLKSQDRVIKDLLSQIQSQSTTE